jgi:DNA invertase Pin-like site-specific DNA recombinase
MTTAAIYTRISLDRTGEALGVTRQYDACAELANRLGWTVASHFDDNDMSAYSGKRRPGFEALLSAIEAGEVDALICWHTDRLYRSLPDLERLIVAAEAHNVALRTVNAGQFDLSTSAGKMIARILGSVSRQEVEHKSERQKAANAQQRAAGKWRNGGAYVFGYDSKGQVVEHEAAMIRAAAADLLAGRSLRSLARQWTQRGVPTRRGGPWSSIGFRLMISNPRYAALVTHRRQVVCKGEWEPILDEETHLALTALLSDPARRSQQSCERRYIGSGVYRCGICGGPLQPVSSNPARDKNGQRRVSYGCRTGFHLSVAAAPLDAYVSEEVLERLASSVTERYVGDDTADVAELVSRRDGLQARLDELGRLFATGDVDASQLRSGSAELHQQLAGVSALLAELLRSSPSANLLNGPGLLEDKWATASAEMKGHIIDELVTVTVHSAPKNVGRWGRVEDRVTIVPK